MAVSERWSHPGVAGVAFVASGSPANELPVTPQRLRKVVAGVSQRTGQGCSFASPRQARAHDAAGLPVRCKDHTQHPEEPMS